MIITYTQYVVKVELAKFVEKIKIFVSLECPQKQYADITAHIFNLIVILVDIVGLSI